MESGPWLASCGIKKYNPPKKSKKYSSTSWSKQSSKFMQYYVCSWLVLFYLFIIFTLPRALQEGETDKKYGRILKCAGEGCQNVCSTFQNKFGGQSWWSGKKFKLTIHCPFKTHINTCRADRPLDCTLENSSFSSFWCTGTEGKTSKVLPLLRKFAALKVCGHCRMTNNDKGERGVGKKAQSSCKAVPSHQILRISRAKKR